MAKALEIGKTSATGGFKLFVGKIASTILLAIGTILLSVYIAESDYGLYTIALIPTTTILLFQDWGVSSGIVKYCSQFRVAQKTGEIRRIIVTGLTFEFATGLILTVLSLLLANFIASSIFGKPESAYLIILSSITILSTGITATCQSIFVGFERMELTSLILVCQAAVQSALMIALVYMGYGALGAVIGYTLSYVVSAIISAIIVYLRIFRKLSSDNSGKSTSFPTLRLLLTYGLPMAVATILTGILPQFYSFIMASVVDNTIIGNFRTATNFAVLLAFLTIPISTVLFPTFSKVDPQKEKQLLKTVFTSSVKYTALLLVPATLAMVVLSQPLIGTLYGNKWLSAPSFLALYVVSNLFTLLGNLSLMSLLSGLGETKMLMKLNILTVLIGVPSALIAIPALGVTGLILVTILAGVPSIFIGLHWVGKHYETKVNFVASIKIFLSSAIAAATTYLFLTVSSGTNWIMLVGGSAIFLVIYLIAAPLLGAITVEDLANLRTMFSGLGFVAKLFEIPFVFIEKILKLRGDKKNVMLSSAKEVN